MSDSAFNTDVQVEPTPTTDPVASSQTGAFNELVGEGKKFADAEALAKGKQESDAYIPKLQEELQGLRDELDKRMTSEDVLAKIREEAANTAQGENTTPSLGKDDIAELVKQTLQSTRTEEVKDTNLQSVDQTLVGKYGDKAGEWLATKAGQLGVSIDFLADVAKTSPDAFFNTVGLNSTDTNTPNVATSSVNTEVVANVNEASTAQPGSKAYFNAIKADDPRKYWKPEVQNAIFASQAAGTYV